MSTVYIAGAHKNTYPYVYLSYLLRGSLVSSLSPMANGVLAALRTPLQAPLKPSWQHMGGANLTVAIGNLTIGHAPSNNHGQFCAFHVL